MDTSVEPRGDIFAEIPSTGTLLRLQLFDSCLSLFVARSIDVVVLQISPDTKLLSTDGAIAEISFRPTVGL